MLFNSLDFVVFATVFFLCWPIAKTRSNLRWLYITSASFVFYGWWDWRFLGLILFSGITAYAAALGIGAIPSRKKLILTLVVLAQILILAIFKYLDFGIQNLNAILGLFPDSSQLKTWSLVLPVGISFYTFQALSYVVDVYRDELKPTRNIFHFFAYLSMFPQLVAGPVVRASCLLPQLERNETPSSQRLWQGFQLVVFGFFKKVVVADSLSPVVQLGFSSQLEEMSGAAWWIVMFFFALQIYCDFSGYSDIACGLGKWMGYEFPKNFNHPYIASSFQEFWGRWHISLSSWFRDYVYIPLGGSRGGRLRTTLVMAITFVVSGLWHGAGWAFLVWGILHASYIALERLTQWPKHLKKLPLGNFLCLPIVFGLTLVSWVFFRVGSIQGLSAFEQMELAIDIIQSMVGLGPSGSSTLPAGVTSWTCLLAGLIVTRHLWFFLTEESKWSLPPIVGKLEPALFAVLIVACVFLRGSGTAFIYFQF